MDRREGFLSLTAMLIGISVAGTSLAHNVGTLTRPGPFLLPLLTGLCLAATGLCSLIGAFRQSGRGRVSTDKLFDRSLFKVLGAVLAMGVYTLILSWVGYLLSTFLLLLFLFKAAGVRRWTNVVLIAFLVTSLSYLLFDYALKVRFPPGTLSLG